MDTKWKKWVSWLCFALGVSALVAAAMLGYQLTYRYSPEDLAASGRDNYQDSRQFRAVMTDYLNYFIDGAREHPHQANYDQAYREDESILYAVIKGDTPLWTNAADYDLPAGPAGLSDYQPIGYNFTLWYDGQTVTLDGTVSAVNLVNWTLPGHDTTVKVADGATQVWLCAKEAPTRGILYTAVVAFLRACRAQLSAALAALAVGAACAFPYLLWRREKPWVDRVLARWTGRVWLECKLLALLLGLWCLSIAVNMLYYARPIPYALLGLWVGYLLVNDCRYNSKPWTHSACVKLSQLWRSSETGLPLQKRAARRGLVAVVGTLPLGALALPLLLRLTDFSFSHPIWMWVLIPLALSAAVLALCYLPLIWYVKWTARFAADADRLTGRVAALRAGDLSQPPALPQDADLLAAADDLSAIGEGMAAALDARVKSERMKVELIANVSHDLKTPLTSIISYAQLLKQEEDLPPHARDYIRILDEKAHRLSAMVQDVFEVSKAASGALPVKREELDLGKLLDQTLADMAEDIERSGLVFKVDLPQPPVLLAADGDRLYRVFQNLFQNALKYSLPGSRVYVTLRQDRGRAVASVKNTSKNELPAGVDFTQRFVRGDVSRTDGGSGLGLAIASSFTTACGGSLSIKTNADLFTVLVEF